MLTICTYFLFSFEVDTHLRGLDTPRIRGGLSWALGLKDPETNVIKYFIAVTYNLL